MTLKPSKKYRAALIGCGSMGSYYMDELEGHKSRQILPIGHAEILKTHPRTELVAGADADRVRLADFSRRWEVERTYTDHVEMLERERPEIVCIASPPPLHPRHVIDCAEHGVKGIFCEKPIAPTLREADAMLNACEKHGVQLSINHTLRGDPYHIQARRLVQAGEIGDLLSITISWAGRLFLTGTHRFDLVNYLVGENPTAWLIGHAESPSSQQTVVPTQRGVDVGGTAYVVFENGVCAFLNGRDGTTVFRVDLIGSKGTVWVDGQDAQLWKRDEQSKFRELLKYPFPQMMRYTAPMVYLIEDLMKSIEDGRVPCSSGKMARQALGQIIATHHSSQNGNCRVDFPFELPDATPPYRWFAESGQVVYDATPKAK